MDALCGKLKKVCNPDGMLKVIDQGINLPWVVIIQVEKRMPVRTIGTLVMVSYIY